MILDKRDDLDAFRRAVREWLADVVPSGWWERIERASDDEFAELERWWMAERNKVGLAAPHWPKEHGGADLELSHQIVIADELARADAPSTQMYIVALNHISATLLPFGTEAQRQKYLPGIPQGDVWCQGFSEPGAGSDLASLRCRADFKGDHYVVNGQKIWSSFSAYARYCILLARTDFDAAKHAGITFFLLDMHAPGVEVRPIRQANGRSEFGEVFLTDVVIPVEDRVGEDGQGWQVAQATLSAERGVLWFDGAERQRYALERFHAEAVATSADWLDDDQLRREFVALLAELQAGRRLIRQLLRENPEEMARSNITPALVKMTRTALAQRVTILMMKIAGTKGQRVAEAGPWGRPLYDYVTTFGGTISAGSNEIMRNIIAERGLGMPKG
jgi:alkylation response protein AidB-like acyl-CoA dehydrogenase